MTGPTVSPQTAELCKAALAHAWATKRRNGAPVPARWQTALAELDHVAACSGTGTEADPAGHQCAQSHQADDWITVSEAAARLGVGERAVRQRISRGRLPARRLGGRWVVTWPPTTTYDRTETRQDMTTDTSITDDAPRRFRVTAPLITVKTGTLGGLIGGRRGAVVVTLNKGALLPHDVAEVDAAAVQRLLDRKMIEEI